MPKPLTTLDGIAAALPIANVDTDQILPAQFMKTTSRKGLGKYLFHTLRIDASGEKNANFVLNCAPWDASRFLISLENFGCGSSREHAPWAILDFGIRCVIAPSFGDIFANNCIKNGILPLTLPRSLCSKLIAGAQHAATAHIQLDLPAQQLTFLGGSVIDFEVDEGCKRRLIDGLDDIDTSLRFERDISLHDRRVGYPRVTVPRDIGSVRIAVL